MKTIEEIRDYIMDMGYGEDVVIFDNPAFASAFVGLSESGRAVYNYDLMVESLMNEYIEEAKSNGTYNENDVEKYCLDAEEFIDYNTIRALPYFDNPPIVLYPIVD